MPPNVLDDLNAQDSDSFSRPSSSRLHKLKLGFNRKANRQLLLPLDKQSDRDSFISIGLFVI
jgi:hypothetical protein